ncbi:alpha-2-macroglobulin-like protein 1 [Rhinoderma darwinii]|uniref:alpha-2-macroglobulin-like protein 1 n=1 Tax=Rhinoderma darwinii TaxID=43563 RepID=UPI003F662BB0
MVKNSWDWWGSYSYPEKKKDIQNVIQDMGLYILSNWNIVAPITCTAPSYTYYDLPFGPSQGSRLLSDVALGMPPDSVVSSSFFSGDVDDESTSKARTFFPETWLWELTEISESGSAEIPVSVPDTITEWSAQMFCAGPGGLGLSSTVPLKAFQPFFVDLHLPYSVKRGEGFVFRVSVFNYLGAAMEINISLLSSEQFQIKNSKTNEISFCLPGGVKRTFSWDVTPTIIGHMNITVVAEAVKSRDLCGEQETVIPKKGSRDVVIQSVLVLPEGTLVEQTHNSMLICDGNSVSEKVKFELPSSYVPGSEKVFISVCGDIMGNSLSNIGGLLTMSHGCGEQNMIRFAPNVYILQYLKISDQLTPTVLAKGKDMLEKGHTRQLMYKRSDGSYSAFGNSDVEGSTWLTAFVMKSFSQARDMTFIDEEVIKHGMDWLKAQQKSNGCFKTTGRVLHNGMKGGVDDENSLSSYVVAGLLESGTQSSDPIVEKALHCIRMESLDNASLYKLALKAYAFTLAKDSQNRETAMQKLYQQATKSDGLMYWTDKTKSPSESYWSKPNSVDVEMTAYVLLSLASSEKPTMKELGDMAVIVRWLCKQQNANGGFSSTQDTVVALQAMAKFASLTSTQAAELTVDVTTVNGFHRRFQIDNSNRLLLQKEPLPEIPGEYTVTVSGTGTVIMQAVQRHNILPATKEAAFVLSVKPLCVNSDLLKIPIEFWYAGGRKSTNMVLLEVNLLSGFVISKESINKLKKNPLVKRVETAEDSVSIYIEKVTSKPQTLELQAEKTVPVTDLKPSIIKIFDYYMPEEGNIISYLINC